MFRDRDFVQNKIGYIQEIFEFEKPVKVYYFECFEYMQSQFPFKLPNWIKGVSGNCSIYLLAQNNWSDQYAVCETIQQIFVHEYLHLAVFETFASRCPLWLNEGLAQIFAEQFHIQKNIQFNESFYHYGEDYQHPEFYLQSALMTYTLIKEYGMETVVERAKRCKDFIHDDIFGERNLERLKFIQ